MDFFEEFKRRMNRYFEEIDRNLSRFIANGVREPLSRIIEKNDKMIIEIELPGVEKKNISLKITENSVEVKAEKKSESEIRKKGFYRKFALPEMIIVGNPKAEYTNGLLRIEIQRKKIPEKKAKMIEVK